MSNWSTPTVNHLRAAGHGAIIEKARALPDLGDVDPVTAALADATAEVRGAITNGNSLDADPTKVPNSLRPRVVRMALFALMELINYARSPDQEQTRIDDQKWLIRVQENGTRFEQPDQDADSAEMQVSAGLQTASETPRNRFTREGLNGL